MMKGTKYKVGETIWWCDSLGVYHSKITEILKIGNVIHYRTKNGRLLDSRQPLYESKNELIDGL